MKRKTQNLCSYATVYTPVVYIFSDSGNISYFIAAIIVGKCPDILLISCIIALIQTDAVEAS
jgi:hypothetical protein